mmetsp:Transcript_19037/g.44351  ORF Transcript_19037/g.44351 Transcript_19037/m.44351 type:complete len:98 (+) Transcript_19037:1191-1484(+)
MLATLISLTFVCVCIVALGAVHVLISGSSKELSLLGLPRLPFPYYCHPWAVFLIGTMAQAIRTFSQYNIASLCTHKEANNLQLERREGKRNDMLYHE